MLLVEVDEDLGVAVGCGSGGRADSSVGAERLVVVDLAVEDDLDRAVLVADRLVAAGQVDDRQPAVDQADARLLPEAFGVGAAVGEASPMAFRAARSTGRVKSA